MAIRPNGSRQTMTSGNIAQLDAAQSESKTIFLALTPEACLNVFFLICLPHLSLIPKEEKQKTKNGHSVSLSRFVQKLINSFPPFTRHGRENFCFITRKASSSIKKARAATT
jgi:hypothetical protein